jgi:hypothetical protein
MSGPKFVIAAIRGPCALTGEGMEALEVGGKKGGQVEVVHGDPQSDRDARL